MEKLEFETEEGMVSFYVLEQTRVNGKNYLLVADSLDEDGEAMIFEDTSSDDDTESVYEVVEDETVLKAVAKIFEESLDDITLE